MRQPHPVTINADLVEALWREIKWARDAASQEADDAIARTDRLNGLLKSMKAAGMAEHLPTLEEVQAEWAALDSNSEARE